jgi:hypothetical protein
MAQKPRNNKFALTPPPLPHIPTLRGLVFFCLQVWVHAGLWRVLRTDRASFSVASGSKRDCNAEVWRLVRHLAPHNSHQRYLQALIRKH